MPEFMSEYTMNVITIFRALISSAQFMGCIKYNIAIIEFPGFFIPLDIVSSHSCLSSHFSKTDDIDAIIWVASRTCRGAAIDRAKSGGRDVRRGLRGRGRARRSGRPSSRRVDTIS